MSKYNYLTNINTCYCPVNTSVNGVGNDFLQRWDATLTSLVSTPMTLTPFDVNSFHIQDMMPRKVF